MKEIISKSMKCILIKLFLYNQKPPVLANVHPSHCVLTQQTIFSMPHHTIWGGGEGQT